MSARGQWALAIVGLLAVAEIPAVVVIAGGGGWGLLAIAPVVLFFVLTLAGSIVG